MITTTEIRPSPALAHLVRCYSWREFDTLGSDLIRPWHACHELSLIFFFADVPVHLLDPVTRGVIASGTRADIVGPGTCYNGPMLFRGRYAFFEIAFRPGGFYRLFHLPAEDLVNRICAARDVLGTCVDRLFEQLSTAVGLSARGALADDFLLGFLARSKRPTGHDDICEIPSALLRRGDGITVYGMAGAACMSVRNFERKFTEQVGIPPKLYSCVERFNRALTMRLNFPDRDWARIAADCGYFDQTHLVKDFHRFAGGSPGGFLHDTPLSDERFLSRVEE